MNAILVIITCVVSISAFSNTTLFYKLLFSPSNIRNNNEYYRFLTHALVHVDWLHLLFNMFALYMFGGVVENYFEYLFEGKGQLYYILLYVGGILFAAIPSFERHKTHEWYTSVGASGAVSAVMLAFVILDPAQRICLYGILCFPGIVWAIIYMIYSWYMAKHGKDNIGHDAHLGGAIFGILFPIIMKPSLALDFIEKIKYMLP